MIPALARGIDVLLIMGTHNGSLSLEDLARKTKIPKASLLRILETLVELAMIDKGSDKRYSSLARIIQKEKGNETFDRLLKKKLLELAELSGGTAEWYAPGLSGLLMVDQYAPSGREVTLSAGPGFLRVWEGELDSVAALGYAFAPDLSGEWSEDLWFYDKAGLRVNLEKKRFDEVIFLGKEKKLTRDLNVNNHGVIRIARPIFGEENSLKGIISLAFFSGPRLKDQLEKGEELLIKNINSEEKNESTLL